MILKGLLAEKLIPDFKALSHTSDGKAVIIEGALAGEEVDVEVIKECKNYIYSRAVRIIKKSRERIEPICDKFGLCGGCELLHIAPESEKKYKDEFFKGLFSRFADIKIEPSVFLSRTNSRDRARFHIGLGKKGFMQRGTNSVIDISSCPLLSDNINKALANLDTSGPLREVNTLSQIPIKVCSIDYHTSEKVFFQSNFSIAEALLDYVSSSVVGESVMDIYAGVGFFSKALERNSGIKNIIAIEENPSCKPLAAKNLLCTVYISSPFEKFNPAVLKNKFHLNRVDTAIIDPPRSGLSKKALANLLKIQPERIIYVSCNIKSNINDIAFLSKEGAYRLVSAKLFDMYPATSHIEAVTILIR